MLVLRESDVRSLLSLEQLLPAMEDALIALSQKKVLQPVRSVLPIAEHHGFWGLMPVVWNDMMGIKLVTVFESNATRDLPTHQASVQLFSAVTGEPLAIMDGRLITELRTAAVSAIATRLLTSSDVKSLAVLGSGVQARSHLRAFALVRKFTDIRIWGPTEANASKLAEEFGARATTLEEAQRDADVVLSVASTTTPIVHGDWLTPHAYVNAVGAVGPHRREVDDAAMNATIIVESREAALQESGDIIGSGAKIYAELGELLAGTKALPQIGSRIVFKSLGVAVEDLAAALLVYRAAGGTLQT
jgi:thiomorpholine-carboxylate dehydrogenase